MKSRSAAAIIGVAIYADGRLWRLGLQPRRGIRRPPAPTAQPLVPSVEPGVGVGVGASLTAFGVPRGLV